MKLKQTIIYLITASLIFTSCGKKEAAPEAKTEQTAKAKDHEEAAPTIASLTEDQIQSVGVTTGPIEMKELTATVKANGLLRVPNNNKATVAAIFSGVVKTLNILEGDYVRKGQVIATITNPEYIRVQEQYLTTISRIAFAEQEFKRQNELYKNDAGTKKNLQSSSSELRTLSTQKASLARQLQMMGINPASVTNASMRTGLAITAPISGTISNIRAQIGSYVDVSAPVAEIIDNTSLHLDLQVFEKDLPRMRIGQIVHFKLTNNPETEYDAKVYSIGSSFENESKTIAVHCTVIGNKTGLIDGMNITGVVSLDHSTTPAIPTEAIVEADGKFYVFIQTDKKPEAHEEAESKDKKEVAPAEKSHARTVNFEKVEVIKGTSDMGYTAITPVGQLAPDAKVVVKGAFFVNAKLTNVGEHEH
ncbi:efflux RND transporter periplasmic adaptor subunit [Elizabethkingia anophelis]|uniref:Efflux RND transporter periplasmic adaptor subunit n=1 Tax=Elizabethkingia anophelis TaxID=1117645 RepID=A0AAE4T806_9FLAO|nr:efflux RND transporter periplasmic adaptor subunit [Elizabethkingia anophelis]MDV3666205.1 efflux RND transporter periplasmic adaptor subunit [Elizabethkingia anophelis]MDV3768433.1 efflux RND transporter periplasmic adaptor subunit [Elizabethkingia anophelis]MVW81858.1 efflux RND transporter periplasmic adaptor subunit [Elizabethkingia anophelis]OCW75133.1 efflux transporter periplasmic adaptor subunit [Elizabethkingia anophelis]HAY3542263.1 efflux RND transporter periplasmic adaptor subun